MILVLGMLDFFVLIVLFCYEIDILGDEGYLFWYVWMDGSDVLVVVVCYDIGVLYGVFYLL